MGKAPQYALGFFPVDWGVSAQAPAVCSPAAQEGRSLAQSGGEHGRKTGGLQTLRGEVPKKEDCHTDGEDLFHGVGKGSGQGFVHCKKISLHAGAQGHERQPHAENPQTGCSQRISKKQGGSWLSQEEKRCGNGQTDGHTERETPGHGGTNHLTPVFRDGFGGHPGHSETDARGGKGHRQHEDGENQLVKSHTCRPHFLGEEGTVAHIGNAQK